MDKKSRRSLLSSASADEGATRKPGEPWSRSELLRSQGPDLTGGEYPRAVRSRALEPGLTSSAAAVGRESALPGIRGSGELPASSLLAPTVDTAAGEREGSDSRVVVGLAVAVGIFLLAALPRLYVLFVVTDPQNPGIFWYGDVFHHWQIAYLSKEVGFAEGFLRLWDFKGMEYFWGLLHPLVLSTLFTITGSADIVIPRLLSVVGASASMAMLFFLLRRHFNLHVALAGVLLAALNPVAIFSDTIGMQEPLGLVLLFLGLLLWPNRAGWTGLLWAMAGMVRAEYWVFGAGLMAVAIITEKDPSKKLAVGLGWAIPSLLYMKYMLDNTGNPIYPIYWNFMAGTAGEWIDERALTAEQVQVQLAARLVLLATGVASAWVLWKRPRQTLLLLLGLGNLLMLGIILGLGAYIRGYVTRVLWDRLMVVPYMYLGLFLAIALVYALPRLRLRRLWLVFGWGGVLITLAVSQLAWKPIMDTYSPNHAYWSLEKQLAEDVAALYQGGTLLMPEDRPYLTYALVRYHGISGKSLEGQMYDPFAYFEGDPFADWTDSREAVLDWLTGRDIRLLVFYTGKQSYEEMIRREPGWFHHLSAVHLGKLQAYEVTAS